MLLLFKAKGDCFLFHNSDLIYVYNCFVHKHVQWEGSNPYGMNNLILGTLKEGMAWGCKGHWKEKTLF